MQLADLNSASIPQQLATATDLSHKQVEAIATALNPIIADSFVLYVKTKNFHWHLSGPNFRSYHLLFDEHAEGILNSIDPLAERLRKIGATTIKGVTQVSKIANLKDDTDQFVTAEEMVARLLSDNKKVAKAMREAIETCDDNKDAPTSDLLTKLLDETERRVWFLFELTR